MSKVIAIANPKGGVGKTTTAINLAASFAYSGHKTLVIDIDPSGAAGIGLGLNKEEITQGLYDLFKQNNGLDLSYIESCIHTTEMADLDIIPCNVWSSDEEDHLFELASKLARLRLIRNYLNRIYDYIIIDCPPFVGNLTVGALAAADSIVIPLQCGYLSIKALSRLMKVIRKIQMGMNTGLKIDGILLTLYEHGTNLSVKTETELKMVFNNLVFNVKIPKNVKLGEAIFSGKPVILFDGRSAGAKAYMQLAAEIIEKEN